MKVFPLLVAAALVAYAALRWRRLSNERRLTVAILVAGFAVYGSGAVHLPNLEHAIRRLGSTLGAWTYLLVGVLAFLETGAFVGLVAPGESAILVGGLVAGQGKIDVLILIGVVWAAAVAGDVTSYLIGRRLGREFLLRHGPKVKITPQRLEQVERFYARHGGKAILLGRFIGLVRAISPFVAGASRLPFRRFLPYDVVGAGLWGTTYVLLGYIFWRSFDQVTKVAGRGALVVGTTIAVVWGAIAGYRYLRVPENRARIEAWLDERARHPVLGPVIRAARALHRGVLRPAAMRLAGPARFAWNRLTPGELGLELTSLLAVALVGGFMFAGTAAQLSDQRVLPLDRRAFDMVDDIRVGVLTDIAKVITDLGSLPGGERARAAGGGLAADAPAPVGGAVARPRPGAHGRGRAHLQGRGGPPPPGRLPGGHLGRELPVGARGVRRGLAGRGGRARAGGSRPGGALRGGGGGAGDDDRGRADPRLPARPLPLRRGRRMVAGGGDLLARGHDGPDRRSPAPK